MDNLPTLVGTKRKIFVLLAGEGQSALYISKRLGIQVSAVRKHLDSLIEMGIVSEAMKVQGVGRPKKLYSFTEAGKEMLPRRYDLMLNEIISEVGKEKGSEYAQRLMERIAQKVNLEFGLKSGFGSAMKISRDLGFMPVAQKEAGKKAIISRNCPLMKVAFSQGEIVCSGFHERILKLSSGSPKIKRESWMNSGDPVCTHVL